MTAAPRGTSISRGAVARLGVASNQHRLSRSQLLQVLQLPQLFNRPTGLVTRVVARFWVAAKELKLSYYMIYDMYPLWLIQVP